MNTADFEKATEIELRRKANECLNRLDDSGSHEKPSLLIEAQFYIGEIERRKQDKIANRDLFLELVVIVLIALELYFGITGGNQQLGVLQKLDTSSGETAAALGTLAEEQKAMRATIEEVNRRVQDRPKPPAETQKLPLAKGVKHHD